MNDALREENERLREALRAIECAHWSSHENAERAVHQIARKALHPAEQEGSETCPGCGGDAGDNWFDRSICACGAMHTCCAKCGRALDGCEYEGGQDG